MVCHPVLSQILYPFDNMCYYYYFTDPQNASKKEQPHTIPLQGIRVFHLSLIFTR